MQFELRGFGSDLPVREGHAERGLVGSECGAFRFGQHANHGAVLLGEQQGEERDDHRYSGDFERVQCDELPGMVRGGDDEPARSRHAARWKHGEREQRERHDGQWGELVLGDLENIEGPGAGSGFVLIDSAPTTWLATEYQIQESAGPVASTWTAKAGAWTVQVAAFRPANGSSATGAGEPPNLSAMPTSAVFTGVPIGTTMTQTIRLMNSGTSSAVITAVSTQGVGFGTSGLTVPLNLAAGATSTL